MYIEESWNFIHTVFLTFYAIHLYFYRGTIPLLLYNPLSIVSSVSILIYTEPQHTPA